MSPVFNCPEVQQTVLKYSPVHQQNHTTVISLVGPERQNVRPSMLVLANFLLLSPPRNFYL